MDYPRYTLEKTISDGDSTKRDIPSFIESKLSYPDGPRRLIDDHTKGKRLFEDDSETSEEPELLQVYLRVKPCKESDLYQVKSERCLVTSLDTATAGHGRRTQHNVSKMYKFSHIFGPNATQKQIFEHVVKDNLKKLSEGHSFTLLTYGASGSGKTYTLMGTVAAPGLVPRSLEYVFKLVDAAQEPVYKPVDGRAEKLSYSRQELEMKFVKNLRQVSAPLSDKYRRMSARLTKEMSTMDLANRTQYYVWVSFVEIYNEAVYDLLVASERRNTSKLRIREDSTGHVYVKGATQAFVRSGEEAYDVMVAGKHNLQVAATGVHARSSRSHCIFTITLLAHSESSVRISCVRLCDLAGAERAGRTQNRGARMQESRAINSSLHVLEKCLHALRRNQRAQLDSNLVPYRESKLTRLLGGGLSGTRGEAVSMVVTINPHPDDMLETKHVLQLATVARDIQVNNTIEELTWSEHNSQNSTVCSTAEVMQLRAENERLHFELAQAHAKCKRLIAESEENRQQAASRMMQLVSEAKDITSQYYKSLIANMEERHLSDLREVMEEYESRLQAAGISTVSTRVKKLMSDRFSRNSSFIEEDELSEQIANLSTQSQNKTLTDDNSSTIAETNRASDSIISDNYSSDEANESLEPNFKLQLDLNMSKQPIGDDCPNIEDSLLKDNNEIDNDCSDHNNDASDNESDSTIDDVSASESANVVEYSTSFKTAENSCNTTDGMCDNKGQSKSKSDLSNIDTSEIDKSNTRTEASTLNASSNIIKQIKIETIDEVDENNDNTEIGANNVIDNMPKALPEKVLETHKRSVNICTRSSIADFEAIEMKIKAEMNASNKVTTPTFLSKSLNKPHNFFEDASDKNQETTKHKHYFVDQKSLSELDNGTNINNKPIESNKDNASNNIIERNKEQNLQQPEANNLEIGVNQTDVHKAKAILEDRSPSIVKDYEMPKNYDPTRIKILLGETSVLKGTPTKNDSIDVFDDLNSPVPVTIKKNNAETQKHNDEVDEIRKNLARTSINGINIVSHSKKEDSSAVPEKAVTNPDDNKVGVPIEKNVTKHQDQKDVKILETNKSNNTVDDFENIYNDLSQTRATEFDLLVSQELSQTNIDNAIKGIEASTSDIKSSQITLQPVEKEKQIHAVKINEEKLDVYVDTSQGVKASTLEIKSSNSKSQPIEIEKKASEIKIKEERQDKFKESQQSSEDNNKEALKQQNSQLETNQLEKTECEKNPNEIPDQTNIQTTKSKYKLRNKNNDLDVEDQEFQKIKEIISKPLTRRNLRLRRRKNDNIPDITENVDDSDNAKLKDIVNLQKEFSDVTMNVPVPQKVVKDIPSPEKDDDDENVAPSDAAATFSKSVTRSRRKLFTPRAEPLEDSPPDTGNSNERIRVPRPSYHRPRARRKL